MHYSYIDGKWHTEVQAADGTIATECGLEVPFAADWSTHEPDEDLCGKCFPKKKPAKKAA